MSTTMELHVRQEPSDRARVLAEMIEQAWHDFTEAERLDVLVLLNRTHAVPIDRIAIEKMLEANNGHIGRTAEALGICRYTLQQKMRALGMPPAKRGPKRKLV